MLLLVEKTKMNAKLLHEAMTKTFQKRNTHEIPSNLDTPPTSWAGPFAKLTAECGLTDELGTAIEIIRNFCIKYSLFKL